MENIDTKEVAVIKQQASKALTVAQELVIDGTSGMIKATDVLSKIKSVGKMIKDRKEQITRPLMEALNSARDLFKPIEQSHAEAERVIKQKMLDYQAEQERQQEAEKARLAARVEKGTMKAETAIKKIEDMGEVQTTTRGKVGEISTRIVRKTRITDETKIPREYLIPDMPRINEAVLKLGKEIPGVEIVEEKVIAAR